MRQCNSWLIPPLAAALLGLGALTAASAQDQTGLVNVDVGDVNVQVPVGVAANVCGIEANVIAQEAQNDPNYVACEADASNEALARFVDRGDGDQGDQAGLVNVDIGDANVQVPVGIAANVCGLEANVIAQEAQNDPNYVACEADASNEALAQFVNRGN